GAAAAGGGEALAGGSDCSAGPFGTGVGRLLLGGAIFWAGPGVWPGTSEGGRGSGEMLKNWACASARNTESQKPTAKAPLAPPALVAAILIKDRFSAEIAANSSHLPRLSQRERYASAMPQRRNGHRFAETRMRQTTPVTTPAGTPTSFRTM